MKPASKSKECPRMSKVKRPAFTMYRLNAARKHTQLRKKLLTDYMLFGLLIAKCNSAWLSHLVGVADPVVEWLECFLVPTCNVLDM